jgi:hypothetical protein
LLLLSGCRAAWCVCLADALSVSSYRSSRINQPTNQKLTKGGVLWKRKTCVRNALLELVNRALWTVTTGDVLAQTGLSSWLKALTSKSRYDWRKVSQYNLVSSPLLGLMARRLWRIQVSNNRVRSMIKLNATSRELGRDRCVQLYKWTHCSLRMQDLCVYCLGRTNGKWEKRSDRDRAGEPVEEGEI